MGSFTFAEKSRTELNFRFKSHFHGICEIVFDNFPNNTKQWSIIFFCSYLMEKSTRSTRMWVGNEIIYSFTATFAT